jgi:hypothetical protein
VKQKANERKLNYPLGDNYQLKEVQLMSEQPCSALRPSTTATRRGRDAVRKMQGEYE